MLVQGQVQGVFFRDTIRGLARESGVAGWVRNRPDGAVEAVLQGPPDAVERLVDFCRTGPPAARVERIDVTDEEPQPTPGFSVR